MMVRTPRPNTNFEKLRFLASFIKIVIVAKPVINVVTSATSPGRLKIIAILDSPSSSNNPAPMTISGIPIIKLTAKADCGLKLRHINNAEVEPEREIPGIKAKP